MRRFTYSSTAAHLARVASVVALFLLQCQNSGKTQTIVTNIHVQEWHFISQEPLRPSSSAPARGRFDDQASVRVISQGTNDFFKAYDERLAGAIQARWRGLLNHWTRIPPTGSAILEFQIRQEGEVTNMRTIQSSGNEMFDLLAQRSVLDPQPYDKRPQDTKRRYANENLVVLLRFSFEEKAK